MHCCSLEEILRETSRTFIRVHICLVDINQSDMPHEEDSSEVIADHTGLTAACPHISIPGPGIGDRYGTGF